MREVCIIGAGIVGTSIAYHLSKSRACSISIVDRSYPGAGTTQAGTGWIAARNVQDPDYRDFRLRGIEEHRKLSSEFAVTPWLSTGGALLLEGEPGDIDQKVARSIEAGLRVEVLSVPEASQLEPGLLFPRADAQVAYFPEEFTISGAVLARILYEAAVENGAVGHLGTAVTGVRQTQNGRHEVVLGDGTVLGADVVVNAAGPDADRIAEHYGVAMPLRHQPGLSVQVRVPKNPIGRMVQTGTLSMKPEGERTLRLRSLSGWRSSSGSQSDEYGLTGGATRNEFIAELITHAEGMLSDRVPMRALAAFSGVRPIPADGLPRVGFVSSVPGYYEAVTHSGGVLGPIVGRLVAEEITSGDESPLLQRYRPARFLARVGT